MDMFGETQKDIEEDRASALKHVEEEIAEVKAKVKGDLDRVKFDALADEIRGGMNRVYDGIRDVSKLLEKYPD